MRRSPPLYNPQSTVSSVILSTIFRILFNCFANLCRPVHLHPMGTGASKSLAATQGPTSYGGEGAAGKAVAPDRLAASAVTRTGPNGSGGGGAAAGGPATANPLGISSTTGGLVDFTRLEEVLGDANSTAKYISKRLIGKGAFGEAYIVERNARYDPEKCPIAERQVATNPLANAPRLGGTYVTKVMDLSGMRVQDRQYARTELVCIAHTHHFAIIRYYEHYLVDSGDESIVIVTEFADHGDLARNLSRARDAQLLLTLGLDDDAAAAAPTAARAGVSPSPPPVSALRLTEREAGMYFVQILAALHHIHRRRMIHRDVKSANLFLTSHGFIKLGDFGFSQKYESTVSSETVAGTFLGTPYYLSPEMWRGMRYGKKADVWAAGIVLYEMLMDGQRPFQAQGLTELKLAVLDSDVTLPQYPRGSTAAAAADDPASQRPMFSPEIRELVRSLFEKDPKLRPSTEELLRTPIMQRYLFLFQRHVQTLIEADAEKCRQNPGINPDQLAFPTKADQQLVLDGCEELNALIKDGAAAREADDTGVPHYESVVYKGSRDGTWKERYLALEGENLIISLSRAKAAVEGTERSKKVPLRVIRAVSTVSSTDPQVLQEVGGRVSSGFTPPYFFVLFMTESSNPIYFGVATAEEVDSWMSGLQRALNID